MSSPSYLATPRYGVIPSTAETVMMHPSTRELGRLVDAAGRDLPPSCETLVHYNELTAQVGACKGEDAIFDQANSGSCTGQAFSTAYRAKLVALAMEITDLAEREAALALVDSASVLFQYQGGRREGGNGAPGQPSEDDGSQIQYLLAFAKKVGVCPTHVANTDLTFADYRVHENVIDDASALRAAADHKDLSGVYHLRETGETLKQQIRAALAGSDPIVGAFPLDRHFGGIVGRTAYDRVAPIVGYHALALLGYTPDGVIVANSWSRYFGDRGYALLSWPFVLREMFDAHVLDIVPTF